MVHDLQGTAFVERVEKLYAERRSFYLSPARWRASRVAISLTWKRIKFRAENKDSVPEARGVYAFVVRHENHHFPPHGFVMYIGITGARAKERTLRDRFSDYLGEKKRNKRPRVHFMLNKYEDDLYFSFCPIADSAINIEQIEIDLNDAIIPLLGAGTFQQN